MEQKFSPTREVAKTQSEKDAEWLEKWQIKNTPGYIKMIDRREFSQEDMDSFMSLVYTFKTNHSLENLLAIIEISEENNNTRNNAKNDLNVIYVLFEKLQKETKITQLQFRELNKEYTVISQAIGMLKDGKIDHTR